MTNQLTNLPTDRTESRDAIASKNWQSAEHYSSLLNSIVLNVKIIEVRISYLMIRFWNGSDYKSDMKEML